MRVGQGVAVPVALDQCSQVAAILQWQALPDAQLIRTGAAEQLLVVNVRNQ
ncbi:hypothetical protein D3C75_1345560 [compost metagenome]